MSKQKSSKAKYRITIRPYPPYEVEADSPEAAWEEYQKICSGLKSGVNKPNIELVSEPEPPTTDGN